MTQFRVRCIGFAIVTATVAVFMSGCGGPPALSVAGTVTLDGKPLGEALISFIPEDKELSPAITSTDLEGKYQLQEAVDGIAEGTYTVRVTTYRPAIMEIDPPVPGVKEKVPAKYNVQTTLTAEVSPGENAINFPLDSKGQIAQPRESY